MKLVVLILKQEELLNKFIKECSRNNIKNVTVFDSDSYEDEGNKKRNTKVLNSIRYALNYYNDESKTIIIPIPNEKIDVLKDIVKDLVPSDQYTLITINIEDIIGFEK